MDSRHIRRTTRRNETVQDRVPRMQILLALVFTVYYQIHFCEKCIKVVAFYFHVDQLIIVAAAEVEICIYVEEMNYFMDCDR